LAQVKPKAGNDLVVGLTCGLAASAAFVRLHGTRKGSAVSNGDGVRLHKTLDQLGVDPAKKQISAQMPPRDIIVRLQPFVAEKAALRNAELERHLDRLREGRPETLETTSLHLDVLHDLRRIHSHICSVAYPVLDPAGNGRLADMAATSTAQPLSR
jgi:hypothetical protein